MTRCPVCGMEIDTGTAFDQSEYMGETYYFCSPECKEEFDQDPEQYAHSGVGTRSDSSPGYY